MGASAPVSSAITPTTSGDLVGFVLGFELGFELVFELGVELLDVLFEADPPELVEQLASSSATTSPSPRTLRRLRAERRRETPALRT